MLSAKPVHPFLLFALAALPTLSAHAMRHPTPAASAPAKGSSGALAESYLTSESNLSAKSLRDLAERALPVSLESFDLDNDQRISRLEALVAGIPEISAAFLREYAEANTRPAEERQWRLQKLERVFVELDDATIHQTLRQMPYHQHRSFFLSALCRNDLQRAANVVKLSEKFIAFPFEPPEKVAARILYSAPNELQHSLFLMVKEGNPELYNNLGRWYYDPSTPSSAINSL